MTLFALLLAQVVAQPIPDAGGPPATPPATQSMPAPPATATYAPAPVAAGPMLWRNIASGMTAEQLRALYPQGPNVTYKNDKTVLGDVEILEGCKAKVNIMHETGFVKEIVMRGEGSLGGRCSAKIIAALSAKYGEPLDKETVGGSLLAREGKTYVWTRVGVTMQFKRYTNGAFGGGGLGSASWEMRYTTTASNIDL